MLDDEALVPSDSGEVPSRPVKLTPRETDVLLLAASRYANAEIAERLGISIRTVESHMAALRRKLEVSDRRALAQEAPNYEPDLVDRRERQRIRTAAAQIRVEAKHQRVAVHAAMRRLIDTVKTQDTPVRDLDSEAP